MMPRIFHILFLIFLTKFYMSAIIIIPFLQIKKLNVQSHLLKDTELVGFKPEFIFFSSVPQFPQ